MEEQIKNAIDWIKTNDIKGCVTGSALLGYFNGQDVDVFCYTEKAFTKLFYAMYHNPMFQVLDPLEQWKVDNFMDKEAAGFKKLGLVTIKFKYNTCVDINIIYKRDNENAFAVISNFDMDIVAKAFDLETKQYLDLSEHLPNKKVTWNKWNTKFYDPSLWETSQLLRQLDRCFKYHDRGYNVDEVILKYIELADRILEMHNIFNSNNYTERLELAKENFKLVKDVCLVWLEKHEISDEELELIKTKIKEL